MKLTVRTKPDQTVPGWTWLEVFEDRAPHKSQVLCRLKVAERVAGEIKRRIETGGAS